MYFWRYHLPAIAFAVLIFLGSSLTSIPPEITYFDFQDKIMHFFEYLVFGYLLCRSSSRWRIKLKPAWLKAAALITGALYAASDEIHQLFVAGRECSFYDFTADVFGLAVGAATFYIFAVSRNNTEADMND